MISKKFHSLYGEEAQITGFTPGRVNLIGEHTDYNGGMVLPIALKLGVTIALSPRADDQIMIWSDQFNQAVTRSINSEASGEWSDYVTGAVISARDNGFLSGGVNICLESTLPLGAGISSSAAVIVGILKLSRDLSGASTTNTELAVLAREVENSYIGLPCGIMDQMAVAIASSGQAIALHTNTLKYELIDLPEGFHIAVLHSGQERLLSNSAYRERASECDEIKAVLGREDICLISDASFATLRDMPEHLQRRARHCMSEHRRTLEASDCLRKQNMNRMGELMIESHISMRDDFEITIPQVDQLVSDAVAFGALGARQTGGGFGGCIVACVPEDLLDQWTHKLLSAHPTAYWVC